jgi:predicted outer membrane repeat protein
LCAGFQGGAIYVEGPRSLAGCSLSSNRASFGGAVYASCEAPGSIESTAFVDNFAFSDGGGLYVATPSGSGAPVMTVSGSSFEKNTASDRGGGIAADYASALALSDDSTFSGNIAGADRTTDDVYYVN